MSTLIMKAYKPTAHKAANSARLMANEISSLLLPGIRLPDAARLVIATRILQDASRANSSASCQGHHRSARGPHPGCDGIDRPLEGNQPLFPVLVRQIFIAVTAEQPGLNMVERIQVGLAA